jgi:hypothetical protein
VDDILAAEKYHLKNIKKILELNSKNIVDQMQVGKIGKYFFLVINIFRNLMKSVIV